MSEKTRKQDRRTRYTRQIIKDTFLEIVKTDLTHSRSNVDFGRGFYVTPLYEQAAKWCGKFKRRGKDGIISRHEYDESKKTS